VHLPAVGKILGVTRLQRPDGVEIHWEAHGEGPPVLLAHHTLWSYPGAYRDLVSDLGRDHRVVVYDPRGCGASTRRGPYDLESDTEDLQAVLAAAGGPAVVIGVGDGINRAARVAARRPDLISHLLAIAPSTAALLPRTELRGSGVMAASDSVIELLRQMLRTDPRAALRSVVSAVNPDLDEDEVRDRVELLGDYLSFEAAADRSDEWLADDISNHLQALGTRLSLLHGGVDPLFEGALRERVSELFPEAQIEEAADGPITRPDLTAARVRRLTGVAAA
jgi:pimeloyl-ACP methyl ester carboxylesterase